MKIHRLATLLSVAVLVWRVMDCAAQTPQARRPAAPPMGRANFGEWSQVTVLSADADAGKLEILITTTRSQDGIHPAALDEATKLLRARADELEKSGMSGAVAEAWTLREAATQLDATRGRPLTLKVPDDALVSTVKMLTVRDIERESRIQFTAQFEEDVPEDRTPQAVDVISMGNQPTLIWTPPRQSPSGIMRWGRANRATFTGAVASVSPLKVDLGNGEMISVNLPKDATVKYVLTKGTRLDVLQPGMHVFVNVVTNEDGSQSAARLYIGETDFSELASTGLLWSPGFRRGH